MRWYNATLTHTQTHTTTTINEREKIESKGAKPTRVVTCLIRCCSVGSPGDLDCSMFVHVLCVGTGAGYGCFYCKYMEFNSLRIKFMKSCTHTHTHRHYHLSCACAWWRWCEMASTQAKTDSHFFHSLRFFIIIIYHLYHFASDWGCRRLTIDFAVGLAEKYNTHVGKVG